jgi:hypothetical protein
MRYELTDHEWTAIRPMLPCPSMESCGCCDPERDGATCPMTSVRTPPATTALSDGGGPGVWGRTMASSQRRSRSTGGSVNRPSTWRPRMS